VTTDVADFVFVAEADRCWSKAWILQYSYKTSGKG